MFVLYHYLMLVDPCDSFVFTSDPVILGQFFLAAENEISYVLCAVHVMS